MRQIFNGNKSCPIPRLKTWEDKGFSIIEILVTIAVINIGLVSILTLATFSLTNSISVKETIQANVLAQETMEAVRNFRDGTNWNTDGLSALTVGVDYYSKKSTDIPPKWQLLPGQETIGGFVRKVIFEKVSRDPATDGIENIYNPANDDSDTRKAIVTVAWKNRKVEIITYFTNWKQ